MKKVALPLLILVLLGGIAVWLWNNQTTKTSYVATEFNVADTASVTRIFMADKNDFQITLDRVEDGWTLNKEFKARPDAIDNLLSTLHLLSIKMPVPRAGYENVIKNLASASVKVEVYQGEAMPSKVFYVGSPFKEHTGTYMLMEGSKQPFVISRKGMVGFLNPYFSTQVADWRNNELFRFSNGNIASVRVEHPHDPEQSYVVSHLGSNEFSLKALASNELVADFDTAKAIDFMARFQRVPFEGFEQTSWTEKRDSVTSTLPQHVFTITDLSGKEYTASTWLKPIGGDATDMEGDSIPFDLERMVCVTPEDDYVVVQYYIFDLLAQKLDYFRKEES